MKKLTVKMILRNLEEILASLLFACTLSLVVLNVITRYVFRDGIPWSEEFATGCFVWTVFLGSAACYKRRAHVGVDLVVKRLPRRLQNAVTLLVDALMAFLLCYMFYISCIYVLRSYRKPTALLGVSSAVFSASLPISFLDMSVWSVIFLIRDIRSVVRSGSVSAPENAEKEAV